MLATLNSRQIVDEIVKDTVKDNDPHDAVQISPDVIRASRVSSETPTLAPEFTARPEPKFAPEPKATIEPKFSPVSVPQAAEPQPAAPSVDTAVRVTATDDHIRPKRSAAGKWLRGAFLTFLFAGGSAAATIAWEKHGDTATQMLAEWTPALASLLPATSQTAPVAAAQAAPPAAQDQTADQTATTPGAPIATAAAAPTAPPPDAGPSVESMTRDIASMAQQIEQLKANIAELKAGQEQMVREMAKPPAPKPIAEAKPPSTPPARMSALPPRAPAPMPPVRKPKPVVSHTYAPAHAPASLAPPPPPSQAAALPPPAVAAPVATTQAVADDDGPVVRPPMPLR
ncbi:hypothetical protein [Bradyrhizobium guangzhouense]|uniref:hypothetical protein n=1 Tax=Bradyrhizobium guangzhouense TaxID=1325095 RepID=UPI001009A07A|nr:hypothetical protein [Bradyrhizobium guangzhouense]RXH14715.1 hypothetical protein EAS54_20220 [Bradyrhizobium guangzhouense]